MSDQITKANICGSSKFVGFLQLAYF